MVSHTWAFSMGAVKERYDVHPLQKADGFRWVPSEVHLFWGEEGPNSPELQSHLATINYQ